MRRKNMLGLLILGLSLGLCACQTVEPVAASKTLPIVVEKKADSISAPSTTPELTPSISLLSSPAPTETLPALPCQQPGRVEEKTINSDLLDYDVPVLVYLPPCYMAQKEQAYPVLYLLHGQSFDNGQWLRLGVEEVADALIMQGQADPFLIVMPGEIYYLKDPRESDYDHAIADVVLPWVDKNYNTCQERSCRAIGGISRGASWAMRLALVRWEAFGAVGAHSFPPFRGDIYNLPYWLKSIPSAERPRIYIDTGTLDPYLKSAVEFQAKYIEYRVPHDWHLFEGTHNEAYWQAHVKDYLQWYTVPWQEKEPDK